MPPFTLKVRKLARKRSLKAKYYALQGRIARKKEKAESALRKIQSAIGVMDKAPKVFDLAVNLALAWQSYKVFGERQIVKDELVNVPYKVWITGEARGPEAPISLSDWLKSGGPVSEYMKLYGSTGYTYGHWETRYRQEYKTVTKTVRNPFMALYGPVMLKLAKSWNLAAGSIGVAGLAALGITALPLEPALGVSEGPAALDPLKAFNDALYAIQRTLTG